MADDAPRLWMVSGTGTRLQSDSRFSSITRYTRADHPEDVKVEWEEGGDPDDVLPVGVARLTLTGWDINVLLNEFKRLWAERYTAEDMARRMAAVAARPPGSAGRG